MTESFAVRRTINFGVQVFNKSPVFIRLYYFFSFPERNIKNYEHINFKLRNRNDLSVARMKTDSQLF
jgi:hypothetical protein